jgi:prepilin peptidase CpaA
MFDATLQATLILLLLIAAWRDLATRLIPDGTAGAVLFCAVLLRAPDGWWPLISSFLAALLLFAVLLVLAMRGLLGGGDVKLAGALAVALPPAATWDLVVMTTFAGGALGLGYIAAARTLAAPAGAAPAGPFHRVLRVEARRIRRRGPLPYAVAIAAGGILVLLGAGT